MPRQLAGLVKLLALTARADHGLDFGDIGVVGVDLAQTIEGLIGQVIGADQLVISGQACQRFSVFGSGEKNLLPQLDGHVRPPTGFEGAGFVGQEGASGLGGVVGGTRLSAD